MKTRIAMLVLTMLIQLSLIAQTSKKTTPTAKVGVKTVTALTAGVFPGTQHQVSLAWTASTTTGVQYNVYRGTATGQETKYVTGVTATTYIDTAVTSGTTYFYYVTAFLGSNESAGSNEVQAVVPANPAPPTGLTQTTQ